MYEICKAFDADFAHHIKEHKGLCVNIHGHTWRFEICLQSESLDSAGFVVDFGEIKERLFKPVNLLLDHSLVLSRDEYDEVKDNLEQVGNVLCGKNYHDYLTYNMNGGYHVSCGNLKLALFDFTPTCERLAEWFYEVALHEFKRTNGVFVKYARVYESLSPIPAYSTYYM